MAAPQTQTATSLRLLALAAVLAVGAAAAGAGAGKRYRVGGAAGWVVPPPEGKEKYYVDWASTVAFYVGDSLEFVYANDSVVRVGKPGYYHCNETAADAAPRDGSTVFVLDAPGDAYFASADLGHCKMGQRLAVSVLPGGGGGQAPSSSPWSSAPGPWSWVLSPSPSSVQHNSAHAVSSSAHDAVILLVVPAAMALALALAPRRFV